MFLDILPELSFYEFLFECRLMARSSRAIAPFRPRTQLTLDCFVGGGIEATPRLKKCRVASPPTCFLDCFVAETNLSSLACSTHRSVASAPLRPWAKLAIDRSSYALSCLPKYRCTPPSALFCCYPVAGARLHRRRTASYCGTSAPLRPWTELAVLWAASVTLPRLIQTWTRASSTWSGSRYWSWSRLRSLSSTRTNTARVPWIPRTYSAILRRALSTATPSTPTLRSVLKSKQQNEDDEKLSRKHCWFHSPFDRPQAKATLLKVGQKCKNHRQTSSDTGMQM